MRCYTIQKNKKGKWKSKKVSNVKGNKNSKDGKRRENITEQNNALYSISIRNK